MLGAGCKYSDAEWKLFQKLGFVEILDHVSPVQVYRYAVEDAFINNKQGPAIEALRRGAKEFIQQTSGLFRMTKEFDALLEFEEKSVGG